MEIRYTCDVDVQGLKVLTYGASGVGKTKMCATLPDVLVISAEKGLLSLKEENLPYVEVTSVKGLKDVQKWAKTSKEATQYKSLAIDSISDLAEVLLAEYQPQFKDGRQAYGKMNEDLAEAIRLFRNLVGYNVYFIAKEKRLVDEASGLVSFIPSIPGIQMMQNLPYYFDLVTVMRFGSKKDGVVERYLQTEGDRQYIAKDRSGVLEKKEQPNLQNILSKIVGEK
jgi:hypothetical protein